tara:strand:+ start:1563 stop:1793 length:231 start_codon:yes stop_codon:yes gene_type:complete
MNVELIKQEVVPVFKPMTVQVTIDTQEEYDAIQRAGKSLTAGEIEALEGFEPYSNSECRVWVDVLELIAYEVKNVD